MRKTLGCLVLLLSAPCAVASAVKLYLAEPGVYRVTHEDLSKSGAIEGSIASARLGLSSAGTAVPIWLDDGGDGSFDPGDRFEFVGERLRGERSYHHEHARLNVYRLVLDAEQPARMTPVAPPDGACAAPRLSARRHLERDLLRVRFSRHSSEDTEVWFWAKLTQIDGEPFRQTIDLDDLHPDAGRPVRLSLQLRGWSRLPADRPDEVRDHRVELLLNGAPLATAEWDNGPAGHRLELTDLPASSFVAGDNVLTLRVTPRTLRDGDPAEVDVVLLNWIEIDYPRSSIVIDEQARFASEGGCLTLVSARDSDLVLYGGGGTRLIGHAIEADGRTEHSFGTAGAGSWHAVVDGRLRQPLAIEADPPSELSRRDRRADYVIVSHPRLLEAIEPLAEFHRERGLSVEVVDVRDVYDEFNHGVVHPRALRDFLGHVYREWTAPAPRFVLLVGDASWDARNVTAEDRNYADWTFRPRHQTRFAKNRSTPYAERAAVNHRNLVPSWSYPTREGHAATDNWFVSLEGDDDQPEMAIGRFPVTEPEEVAVIVEKTIRHASGVDPGPWRRRVLWITNEQPGYQQRSDDLARPLLARGFAAQRVYPARDEPSNETHRAALHRAFNEGQFLVHFFGHGGRYIWRTGPPDLEKNHDLFTLEDLDRLEPSRRLPIVLSMTCYSAPFDHPNADSIGEKFLRVADRGAVAVIAASWRNSPDRRISELLLEELTRGDTVGEAFMRAKRRSEHRDFLNQYNLLGDPALPIDLPPLDVSLELVAEDPPRVRVQVQAEAFDGRAVVDWVRADGELLHRQETAARGTRFESSFAGDPLLLAELGAVQVYLLDERSRLDGIAAVEVEPLTRRTAER